MLYVQNWSLPFICLDKVEIHFPSLCLISHYLLRNTTILGVMCPIYRRRIYISNMKTSVLCASYNILRVRAVILRVMIYIWMNINICHRPV